MYTYTRGDGLRREAHPHDHRPVRPAAIILLHTYIHICADV